MKSEYSDFGFWKVGENQSVRGPSFHNTDIEGMVDFSIRRQILSKTHGIT